MKKVAQNTPYAVIRVLTTAFIKKHSSRNRTDIVVDFISRQSNLKACYGQLNEANPLIQIYKIHG
jgi:hypothetical protein